MLFLSAVILPSILLAQGAPMVPSLAPLNPANRLPGQIGSPAVDALADNYEFTLVMVDKDGPPAELAIVIASPFFQATLDEPSPSLSFGGNVTVAEDGRVLVSYALGWKTKMRAGDGEPYTYSSTQSSVRLKSGEEVQILRAGTQTARLSVKKLEAGRPK